MSLAACKSCGKVFDTESNHRELCFECYQRIEKLYNKLHEFIKNDTEINFDIDYLADMLGVTPADIRELIKFGYIERDIQTYGKGLSPRQELAIKLNEEIKKLDRHKQVSSYGGKIYKRK
ncbi:MAG: hypothetical protein IJP48_08545 [Synergistaceae bacterium]|nr:hypothetical protein [Synergistaceae bacterium]